MDQFLTLQHIYIERERRDETQRGKMTIKKAKEKETETERRRERERERSTCRGEIYRKRETRE